MLDSLDVDFISSDLDELVQNAEQNLNGVRFDAVSVYKVAIKDVKALFDSYLEKSMSDAEFNKRLEEAKAKPMTPKGTDEVVDCYLSTSDRIVLSRAQEILIRLAEGMDRDHVAHIDFVEKNKERVSMKPKEYTTNLINSVSRALYEIEKAREIKK
ncbi:MAG: hypothetical protein K6E94_04195 [Elusimicrobiaceae bacterium]|nr:hypothetical protein [Elusimicrobiaceae bacterium]